MENSGECAIVLLARYFKYGEQQTWISAPLNLSRREGTN
jgi:hypothetical protein